MKYELKPYHFNVSDEDLLADLKRVARELKKEAIPRTEYDKHGKYSEGTLRKRFGGWLNALERAGLKKTKHHHTDNELINELRRIAKLLNKEFVSVYDFRKHSAISNDATIARRFGSWTLALKKAGLSVSPSYRERYSTEYLFENMLNVWTHYGRQPTKDEMDEPPSNVTSACYARRFGGYRKALEAFVARMNKEEEKEGSDDQVPKAEIVKGYAGTGVKKSNIVVEDKRGIGLGLRYKVLSRDKFKCVRCGSNPAANPKCLLHVDHIIPFSKGGKTALNNLQTLCEDCNLGKGNRHSE